MLHACPLLTDSSESVVTCVAERETSKTVLHPVASISSCSCATQYTGTYTSPSERHAAATAEPVLSQVVVNCR